MNYFWCAPLLALLLGMSFGHPAAGAVIFADNFNTPAFPVGVDLVTYPGWSILATTPSTRPGNFGWFVGGAGVDHMSPTIGHVGSDGGAWVDLNALDSGSIEAAIVGSFVAGRSYTLSFMMNTATPGNAIAVEITNGYAVPGFTPSVLATAVATPSPSPLPLDHSGWQPYSIAFTADVTHNIVMKFTSQGPGAYGSFLDEVAVRDEVPEPSTWILSGVGLLAAGLARSRSRRLNAPPRAGA